MRAFTEHHFTGPTNPLIGIYNSAVTGVSTNLFQYTGPNEQDQYIAPKSAGFVNLREVFTDSQQMPHVYQWSSNIFWVFTGSIAAAAATRSICLYEFNSDNGIFRFIGAITLSGTAIIGNKTINSLRSMVYKHTTGTVSTSGSSSTINGSGTGFVNERIAVGARIGFGTTDPTAVTAWYEILSITNDTTLTIIGAVNLAGSTPYVIEEIRIALAVSNSSVLLGGVYLIKGLNPGAFNYTAAPSIVDFASVDNIRASYLLRDQIGTLGVGITNIAYSGTANIWSLPNHGISTGDVVMFTSSGTLPTNVVASTRYFVISTNYGLNQFSMSATFNGSILAFNTTGTGIHTITAVSNIDTATIALSDTGLATTNHDLYLLNRPAANVVSVSRYNIRAPLITTNFPSVSAFSTAGITTSAFVYKTNSVLVPGTVSQLNCGRIVQTISGIGSAEPNLYFISTTRIHRCPLSGITIGSSGWIRDTMLENPPGGTTTYNSLSSMAQIDYSSTIDRFYITNTLGRFGVYVTGYATTSTQQFDKYVGANLNRIKLVTTATGASDGLFPVTTLTLWTEGGYIFAIPAINNALGQNWLYAFPAGVDAFYNNSSNEHVVTPKLSTPNASKFYHVYVDHMDYAGDDGLGFPVESYRIWYRTTGIDDNSGSWIELLSKSNLESATPSNFIQFKIAFDILGEICVPTRIYSIAVTYEDSSQDSHYQPSFAESSIAHRIFAYRQVASFGSNIPDMRIRLFDALGATLLNDTVLLPDKGTWGYSTNGLNWNVWDATQDNVGNYIRYSVGVWTYTGSVRALLTQV